MRKAKSTYLYSAFVLGLLSIAIQTIFLRELFAVYGFSEILLAVLLFFWLLWGAIGSITHHRGNFLSSIVAFGVLGVVIPLVVRISALKLRPVFGMTTPFWDVFIAGFLCSAPTFFAGRTFSALAKMDSPAKLYAAEGIGALVGGIVAAVSLSAVPPKILLSVLALIAISPLILNVPRRFITFVMLLAAAYLSDVFLIPPVNSVLWRGFTTQEIESPYGRIFIMQKSGENYIFENGRLVASSGDSLSCEQIVHPVMWAHFSPKKVLIIGGAMKGAVRDAAKHGVSQIVVPFPDEKLLEVAFATMPVMRNLHIGSDVDAEFVPAEVRSVLAEERNFDVIVSMPGFPETGADNRFWTEEFFKKVKFALSDSGIFAAALPVGANYLSEYQNEMAASIWMTAKKVFPDAEIYFLDGVVLIAAEKGGQIQLRERLLSKNLRQVNAATVPVDYLPILFQKERSKTLEHQLNDAYFVRINNDWEPLAYLWGIFQQAALANLKIPREFASAGRFLLWFGVVAVIAIVLLGMKLKSNSAVLLVLCGGFWGLLSQSLFMLIFQANFGNLYYLVGAAVGTFLFGSAAGSLMGENFNRKWQILIPSAAFSLIIVFVLLGSSGVRMPIAAFFLVFMLSGMISGVVFGGASKLKLSGGKIYAFDLFGAAAGAVAATIAIPTMMPIAIVLEMAVLIIVLSCIIFIKN